MKYQFIKYFIEFGLSQSEAESLYNEIKQNLKEFPPEKCWELMRQKMVDRKYHFDIQQIVYRMIYPSWQSAPAPAWFPDENVVKSNIHQLIEQLEFKSYEELHKWSVNSYDSFWQTIVSKLGIVFSKKFTQIVNLVDGIETPQWFVNAKLNIVDSCFQAKETDIAIIEHTPDGLTTNITYAELEQLTNRVANGIAANFSKGDRIAIIMPMNAKAIAIYLGIIKAGCCVVSISDNFAAKEIAKRLQISNTKAVFTQYCVYQDEKVYPLYEKIIDANSPCTIVLPTMESLTNINLRKEDIYWENFLHEIDSFKSIQSDPEEYINILFSSGTAGEPKAIPWSHVTPIKCASDALLHLDIKNDDIICWPTNLGWMMGPWLVFAALLNKATIALYSGLVSTRKFGQFIADHKITILGVIPTLVKKWHESACMEGLDWSHIRLLSSTAECSNVIDMLYLMWLTNYKPIIEYCGGTEIGGAYISGTVIQPCAPAAFTTPALGIDFKIIDEEGSETENGAIAIIGPSIGLSTKLLNKNHHQTYYARMPLISNNQVLRRHGDHIEKFANGFYRVHGRIDDTINLSGIKISSAAIESVLNNHPDIVESAAIGIAPKNGGPNHLVIYAVVRPVKDKSLEQLKSEMQASINQNLNPVFKIQNVVIVDFLPRTATDKIMRLTLKEEYKDRLVQQKHAKPAKIKKKQICLALQGGGAYGAYTWGILDKLLEDERIEIDAISATSAGSVNSAVLAYGLCKQGNQGAREALYNFWQALSTYSNCFSPVKELFPLLKQDYDFDLFSQYSFFLFDLITRIYSPYILNPFDFNLLRWILLDSIDFNYLRTHNKVKLFICATNVKSGMQRIFENTEITVDTIVASACLPQFYQAIEIDGDYYWDGGYLGNPTIYPLIYNSQVHDIVIVHNNPIKRATLPYISTDIASRENEISFNSSLLRELRAIAFITKLIDKGWIKDEYQNKLPRKFIHIMRSDEVMNQFSLMKKFNWNWEFVVRLRDLGRSTAENWLKANFHHLSKKSTINFSEFLGVDSQTS